MKGRTQGDSHIFLALWGNRWWCRHLSAGFVKERSWFFHLAVGCSCLVSIENKKKGQLGKGCILRKINTLCSYVREIEFYMPLNTWAQNTVQGHECKHSLPNPASTINIGSPSE